jgi:trigger factor
LVFEALLNHVPFELPETLIKEEIASLMKQTRETMQERGLKDPNLIKLDEALFVPRAEKRIRLGLIVADLTEKNNLKPRPEQLRAHIDELVESYESPDEVRQWFFSDRARLADVEFEVAMHNVTEYVFSQVQVTEKALSFDELMGKQQS